MKKIIHIFLWIFLSFFLFGKSSALDERVAWFYDEFLAKIESKYTLEQRYIILEKVNDTAQEILLADISWNTKSYFEDLIALNNEMIYELWLQKESDQSSQKLVELRARLAIEKSWEKQDMSSNIESLLSEDERTYISTNSEREFVQDGDIYRVDYSQYYTIDSSTVSALRNKKGIMLTEWWQERFIENYSFQKKIPYSELTQSFLWFLTPNHKTIKKHGNYYAYNFTKFRFFDDSYWVYMSQLESSNMFQENTLVYRDEDGKYNFVTDYTAHGVIPAESIFGLPEKHVLLDALRDDSKYPTTNIGNILAQIEDITQDITQWKSREDKIAAIYEWILTNISYTTNIDINNQKIFSAIETFKGKSWVCTGYSKLMLYMLLYAGIDDVEVIRWHVIDAADFPEIGHAWIRIGNKYYDPTFDDPLWLSQVKTLDQYKYFWLPKDIFYANRYEYDDLPEVFKTAVPSQINEHIYTTLKNLIPKYQSDIDSYKVFLPVVFRENYNIGIHEDITPELLSEKLWSFNVENNSFNFIENGVTKRISHLRYYILDTDNTEDTLEVLNYDIEDMYLFYWKTASGTREWRLAYELETQ